MMLMMTALTPFLFIGDSCAQRFSPLFFSAWLRRVFTGNVVHVFNRRTVARCWMIQSNSVGSGHMNLCFPFVENGEGGSHHGNEERI